MNLVSLDAPIRLAPPLPDGFFFFARDQVLLPEHLNQLIHFLDVQDRLSRVWMHGTGVVTGLDFVRDGNVVVLQPGAALTSDGDLLPVMQPLRLTHKRTLTNSDKYAGLAPLQPPFTILTPNADAGATPLTNADLADKVLAIYVEAFNEIVTACSISSCDHKGAEHRHNIHVLLLDKNKVAPLGSVPASLPAVAGPRVTFDGTINQLEGANGFQGPLVAAITQVRAAMLEALGSTRLANAGIAALVKKEDWDNVLPGKNLDVTKELKELPLIFDFWRHFCAAYNEWRDCQQGLRAAAALAPSSHPKHVLLGDVNAADDARDLDPFRHALVQAAGNTAAPRELRRARLLWQRLVAMPKMFKPAPALALNKVKIILSRQASAPVGLQARPTTLTGTVPWNPDEPSQEPFAYSTIKDDHFRRVLPEPAFFRIEGHLGRDLEAVTKELEEQRALFNLGFQIVAVQIEEDFNKAVIPPFRFLDLETLYHQHKALLTLQLQDAADHLDDVDKKTEAQKERVKNSGDIRAAATKAKLSAKVLSDEMQTKSFATFASTPDPKALLEKFQSAMMDNRTFSATTAPVVEEVSITPAIRLAQPDLPVQIVQVFDILRKRRKTVAEQFTFASFRASNPGLEPLGGVAAGGTLVLLYSTAVSGKQIVKGDAALPYYWRLDANTLPPEEEPALPVPPKVPVPLPGPFPLPKPIIPRPRPPIFVPPWVDPLPPDFELTPKPPKWIKDNPWNIKAISEFTIDERLEEKITTTKQLLQKEVKASVLENMSVYNATAGLFKGAGNLVNVNPAVIQPMPGRPDLRGDADFGGIVNEIELNNARLDELRAKVKPGVADPALEKDIKAAEKTHAGLITKGNTAWSTRAKAAETSGKQPDPATELMAKEMKKQTLELQDDAAKTTVKKSFTDLKASGGITVSKNIGNFDSGF